MMTNWEKTMHDSTSNGHRTRLALIPFLVFAPLLLLGCGTEEATKPSVSFSKQITPILQNHCLECHTPNKPGHLASGLDMSTYDSLMKGTKFGPVITPGKSVSSTLVILVEGRADPSIKMPHGDRPPLSQEQIHLLRQWIDEGAKNN